MRVLSFAAGAAAVFASFATMVVPQRALAACATPIAGAVLTPAADLLTKFPAAGGALVSEVRNLVTTNLDNLGAVMGLVPNASVEQKRAIGAGLGQAAAVCLRTERDSARPIQEAILKLDDRELLLAFQAATGERQTAAIGGGGGASGGGLGGGGVGIGSSNTSAATSGFFVNPTSMTPNSPGGLTAGSGSSVPLATVRSLSSQTVISPSSP